MNPKKNPTIDPSIDSTNRCQLSRRFNIEDEFEEAVKEEVRKLEGQMKIGISTLRNECWIDYVQPIRRILIYFFVFLQNLSL